jgi:hypothetical protein
MVEYVLKGLNPPLEVSSARTNPGASVHPQSDRRNAGMNMDLAGAQSKGYLGNIYGCQITCLTFATP